MITYSFFDVVHADIRRLGRQLTEQARSLAYHVGYTSKGSRLGRRSSKHDHTLSAVGRRPNPGSTVIVKSKQESRSSADRASTITS
jgi:hypothetical protein